MARSRLATDDKRTIIEMRSHGEQVDTIAELYGVSGQTIRNIWNQWTLFGETMFAEDGKKEEPASAATDTSSETEIVVDNISEDIIPDIPEDVKGQEEGTAAAVRVPDAVLEACRERIAALRKDIESWQASIDIWNAEIHEMQEFIGRSMA